LAAQVSSDGSTNPHLIRLFTMYGGRVRFAVPMLWSIGFIVTFIIGGLTGVLLAVPPADFLLHNSMFLIAHFHNVIIGGVLFGAFAGYGDERQ
jgi:cytochrome o ubiquinol oxidase subunit 1